MVLALFGFVLSLCLVLCWVCVKFCSGRMYMYVYFLFVYIVFWLFMFVYFCFWYIYIYMGLVFNVTFLGFCSLLVVGFCFFCCFLSEGVFCVLR
jgi:hypothetical protein